jgi:hypothetical protein
MPRFKLTYLDNDSADKIEKIVQQYASDTKKMTGEQLVDRVTEELPIQRSNQTSVRRRVEGYYFTTEILWTQALKYNDSRPEIVKIARLKPLSHYHYLTGSREPITNVMTRADYLNDPSTALVKLRDDIIGLCMALEKLVTK